MFLTFTVIKDIHQNRYLLKDTKRSITFKIIAGYILVAILAVIAFGIIYRQLNTYTLFTKNKNENNEKLFLVGQTLTSLYEAESLTRNIIQTSDVDKFKSYTTKIDTIVNTISKLSKLATNPIQIKKLDSIKYLIDSKNKNLEELIEIYTLRKEQGVYKTAITELKKTNESFGTPNYEKRFKNLNPEFRKRLINILHLSKEDNAKRLTNQTVDSLAKKVRQVLAAADKKDQQFKKEIFFKENKLLKNDKIITKQLRSILAAIELNERGQYYNRLKASNEILSKTVTIILLIAAASIGISILFLFLIIKDVSKSQQYRNALEAEKLYKESLLQTRESLINTVTHDLRSPLNTVIGYSDLLEKTTLNTKQKHYLTYLKKSSNYILHLVNDLLDLSKLEAGRMVIETLPFCPEKLIQDTVSDITTFNEKKGLHISIHIDAELKKQYLGDPFRIKQILTNLVNNAYKFTDKGLINVNGHLLSHKDSGTKLILAVKDTGIGITTQQQQYIFEEFSQGDTTTEKKHGGFGLGLAITKKIVTLLDGEINLDSSIGIGSTFTITIPIHPATAILTEEEDTEVTNPIQYDTHTKVLIVDDDPSQLALTSEVITMIGLAYDVCDTVDKALQLVQKFSYSLILTDIQMPIKDGFEFLTSLQNNKNIPKIPIIALSGKTDISEQEYKDLGFSESLRKPYTPKALIDLITTLIAVQEPAYTTHQSNTMRKTTTYTLEDLILFAQGDTDSLNAILDAFYESTTDSIAQLKESSTQKDIKAIAQIAHKILPMFKQIKAHEVVSILDQLEHQKRYNLSTDAILDLTQKGVIKIETLILELQQG